MNKFTKPVIIIITCLFLITFKTEQPAHAQTERITFAVIGDYGLAGQPLLDVSNLIKSWNPDFIVTTGDNNYPDGAAGTIDENVGQYFHDYLINYSGKYGSGSATRRFYPSLGNHDWISGANYYFKFFDYNSRVTYYDFTQGSVHFFVLDSDRKEPDGITPKSQQGIWLRKALAASTSQFNVVVLHHAPYSSGKHGSTEYMRWPFKEWGADVILAGHDHIYERLLVDGLPYFVNGIGGAEIYHFQDILPQSLVRFNQDFGAMRVEATSATMKFQMYTRAGILIDEYVIGGSTPIVTSITGLEANPSSAGIVNFQVNFSEAVTGVDISDFILTTNLNGANIANVSGDGNTYVVSINTGSGDGNLRLDLTDNDSVLSSLGIPLGGLGASNGNFTTGTTYIIDRTSPTATSISPVGVSPTNAATVDFNVTFSEPVNGVDLSDYALVTSTGAMLTNISGAGSSYTVTVATGIGNDSLRLDFIDNDSVIDSAENTTATGFVSGGVYNVDRSAPVVLSVTPAGQPNASSVEYTVSFSEPVTGVDGSDFILSTINGATIANVTGTGNLYTVSINLQPGSDSIRLDTNDNNSIADAVGNSLNGNFIGGVFNIAIDTPIATSIIRASANPTNAASVDFIVTFSETVTGVDASDFVLTNNAFITNIINSNPFYIVSVSSLNDGELKMDLVDNDSIVNAEGIPLGGNGAGNANFNTGESYSLDRTPPQVTSIIRASSNPAINPTADFIVTFSEWVNGVENSDFAVAGINVIKSSVLNVQSANPFYWVTVNTGAGSGTIRLDLFDNGNITDLAGNPLALNHYTLGESFTLAKTPVDFSAPTITSNPLVTNNPFLPVTWLPVRNAQAYEIFVARDNSFSQIVLSQTQEGTTFTPQTPLTDGTYYVRVRAYDSDLNPGKWSKIYTFSVDATAPAPPVLRSPTNGSSAAKRPWLSWHASEGGIKYQIEISRSADFINPAFSAVTSKTTIQSKTLISRLHYWRVRVMDAAGNWSEWSTVLYFTVR